MTCTLVRLAVAETSVPIDSRSLLGLSWFRDQRPNENLWLKFNTVCLRGEAMDSWIGQSVSAPWAPGFGLHDLKACQGACEDLVVKAHGPLRESHVFTIPRHHVIGKYW